MQILEGFDMNTKDTRSFAEVEAEVRRQLSIEFPNFEENYVIIPRFIFKIKFYSDTLAPDFNKINECWMDEPEICIVNIKNGHMEAYPIRKW